MIDDTKMAVPRISYFLSAMYKIAHVLKKKIHCYFMDEHCFYAFHRKIYCLGCHHCMSPVPLDVNEAPAHLDRPMISLYPILPGSEKQMNTSFKVLLRRHSNYHYNIRFSKNNVLYTQYDWLLFSTVIKLPLSVNHCSSNMNRLWARCSWIMSL